MPCHHPFKAWWTGYYTDNGKKEYEIRFDTPGDLLDVRRCKLKVSPSAPMKVVNGVTFLSDPVPIPCGTCIGCRLDKAKEWTSRLVCEAQSYPFDMRYFVTLTYSDEYARPVTKDEMQRFLKRLRKYTGRKFRYFACGEYGETTFRPHYHLILFGSLSLDEKLAKNVWHSKDIEDAWPFGLHEVSIANVSTFAYVAGYVQKKQVFMDSHKFPTKPFIMMSRKPLLGAKQCFALNGRDDYRIYGLFGENKFSESIPSAFLRKHDDEPWVAEYKEKMKAFCEDSKLVDLAVYGTMDEERLGFLKDDETNRFLDEKRRYL